MRDLRNKPTRRHYFTSGQPITSIDNWFNYTYYEKNAFLSKKISEEVHCFRNIFEIILQTPSYIKFLKIFLASTIKPSTPSTELKQKALLIILVVVGPIIYESLASANTIILNTLILLYKKHLISNTQIYS